MAAYIVRRLLFMIPTLLGIMLVSFVVIQFAPGGPPVWVEPAIVITVEYKEWTHDDHLRAPVYKGIDMTDPETVTWASEGPGD